MTNPTVLAIGQYTKPDQTALANDLQACPLPSFAEVGAMTPDERASVRAVCYKGQDPFGPAHMDLLPNLGLIANYGVGYDAIDVAAANARSIRVTNTPDVLNDDVADTAVALLLSQARQFQQGQEWIRSGNWSVKGEFPLNRKVSGGKAGILGMGRIGREIADRLAAFKMDIHYHTRSEKQTPGWTYHADPVSLANAVDFMVIALVGGPDTEKYVSKDVIQALGPKGILVNISRGTTVDEAALLNALETGQLGGAALDVFLNEPNIDARFATLDNVFLQPHQGSGTVETRAAMGQLQRDNIQRFLGNQDLLTPVN
jgi:lactate dehydrogenase-like 2-hydroxyacid dehydrogenase